MAVTISGVLPGSSAARKWIRPGDRLLTLNGHEITDVLDYRFYLDCPQCSRRRRGREWSGCIGTPMGKPG